MTSERNISCPKNRALSEDRKSHLMCCLIGAKSLHIISIITQYAYKYISIVLPRVRSNYSKSTMLRRQVLQLVNVSKRCPKCGNLIMTQVICWAQDQSILKILINFSFFSIKVWIHWDFTHKIYLKSGANSIKHKSESKMWKMKLKLTIRSPKQSKMFVLWTVPS